MKIDVALDEFDARDWQVSDKLVLMALIQYPETTRYEVRDVTGLGYTTVVNAIERMEKRGLVAEEVTVGRQSNTIRLVGP